MKIHTYVYPHSLWFVDKMSVSGPLVTIQDTGYQLVADHSHSHLSSCRPNLTGIMYQREVVSCWYPWWCDEQFYICSPPLCISYFRTPKPSLWFSLLPLRSSIVKSILTWDEEEINTSNFLPRSSLILPASSQQLCRENRTKTRWKMQARDQKLARVWKCWEIPLKVVTDFLGLTGFQ